MAYDSMYGSVLDAESYFATRLNTDAWLEATQDDQKKALISATRRIERLNFNGDKTDPTQTLEFPRGGDTVVPTDILIACYEIALSLLDGADADMDFVNATANMFSVGGARMSKESTSADDHIRAGIPSVTAWNYLKPYLRDPRSIRLSKV